MNLLSLLACSLPFEVMKAIGAHIDASYYFGITITAVSLLVFQILFPRNRGLGILTVLALQSSNIVLGYQKLGTLYHCYEYNHHALYLQNSGLLLFFWVTASGGILAALVLIEDKRFDWLKGHFYWLRPKRI